MATAHLTLTFYWAGTVLVFAVIVCQVFVDKLMFDFLRVFIECKS